MSAFKHNVCCIDIEASHKHLDKYIIPISMSQHTRYPWASILVSILFPEISHYIEARMLPDINHEPLDNGMLYRGPCINCPTGQTYYNRCPFTGAYFIRQLCLISQSNNSVCLQTTMPVFYYQTSHAPGVCSDNVRCVLFQGLHLP